MKNFVYMMLVGSAAAQMTEAEEKMMMDAEAAAMATMTETDKKAMDAMAGV